MKFKITVLRRIVKIDFPPGIDYKKLASKMNVPPMAAWYWLQSGRIDERHIPELKKIKFVEVRKTT